MRPYRERDILEYFPLALYTMTIMVKAGQSLEQACFFVASNDFGRISLLFWQVMEIAREDRFLAGLESIRGSSHNRYYREAIMVMILYAKHGTSLGDRLVALGHRMESEAVMQKRNHYRRVRDALIPQTTMMIAGVGLLLVVIYSVLTRDWVMQEGAPVMTERDAYMLTVGWLVILAFMYPVLYIGYIFRNPAFVIPGLGELGRLIGNENDQVVSRFLTSTAQFITMGWSLEMAVHNSLHDRMIGLSPASSRSPVSSASERVQYGAGWEDTTFDDALHSVGARANSRKYQLTVRFLREARRSGSVSLAETLNILSDTFWSSHMTRHYYQSPLLTPVVLSFSLKYTFIFFLSVAFPMLAFFFGLVLVADSLLLLLCMS